jgi:hypothetical protein
MITKELINNLRLILGKYRTEQYRRSNSFDIAIYLNKSN